MNPAPIYYPPLARGKYDVVVDVNDNGRYDVGIDALDGNDRSIPEFPSLLILLLFMILTLARIVSMTKRAATGKRALKQLLRDCWEHTPNSYILFERVVGAGEKML